MSAPAWRRGDSGRAHPSVSLRRNAPRNIGPQLARLPKGAVILMGVGLNDAAIPVQGLRNDIESPRPHRKAAAAG